MLVISLAAELAFLFLPLALHGGRHSPLPLLYFVAVGLGYILVEIAFIQRFVLFRGHPTYALTEASFCSCCRAALGACFRAAGLPAPNCLDASRPRGRRASGGRVLPAHLARGLGGIGD